MPKVAKRMPQRMCVGCREMKDKNELIRVIVSDTPTIDLTGKAGGRGVYFCRNKACLNKALKNKNFAKQNGFAVNEQFVQAVEALLESKS